MSKVAHTTIKDGKLFCLHCGGEFALNYPVQVKEMTQKIKGFNALHGDCEPTWTEPKVNQGLMLPEKAAWWLANGEIGASSMTMWNCLIGNKDFEINHPYDPDDFSRCWKLLEAVPEWKTELDKLKPLSKAWGNLVENWDKLTEMYELNILENWSYADKIGMYEFMRGLINNK